MRAKRSRAARSVAVLAGGGERGVVPAMGPLLELRSEEDGPRPSARRNSSSTCASAARVPGVVADEADRPSSKIPASGSSVAAGGKCVGWVSTEWWR